MFQLPVGSSVATAASAPPSGVLLVEQPTAARASANEATALMRMTADMSKRNAGARTALHRGSARPRRPRCRSAGHRSVSLRRQQGHTRRVSDGDGPLRGLSDPTVEITPGGAPRREASKPEILDTSARSPFDRSGARFERRGELGRGGMGRVEDAFDHTLDRPVAIKQLLRGNDLDVTRFEREVRLTARLEHPGIVPVHDAGRDDDGTPYYVMR